MKTIKLLGSNYQNENTIEWHDAMITGIKTAQKTGIQNFSNIEYCPDHKYINFTIENGNFIIPLQYIINEKKLYFRYSDNQSRDYWNSLPWPAMRVLSYLGNENAQCNYFKTLDAVALFLFLLDDCLKIR